MYRYKKSVGLSYEKQGYIYFASRMYAHLPESERARIRALCQMAGGEYAAALLRFVTTDDTATAICMKYHLSRSTLYRAVRRYYESF